MQNGQFRTASLPARPSASPLPPESGIAGAGSFSIAAPDDPDSTVNGNHDSGSSGEPDARTPAPEQNLATTGADPVLPF